MWQTKGLLTYGSTNNFFLLKYHDKRRQKSSKKGFNIIVKIRQFLSDKTTVSSLEGGQQHEKFFNFYLVVCALHFKVFAHWLVISNAGSTKKKRRQDRASHYPLSPSLFFTKLQKVHFNQASLFCMLHIASYTPNFSSCFSLLSVRY